MSIRVVKAAKYLGIITGDDPELTQKAICDRIDKIISVSTWAKGVGEALRTKL